MRCGASCRSARARSKGPAPSRSALRGRGRNGIGEARLAETSRLLSLCWERGEVAVVREPGHTLRGRGGALTARYRWRGTGPGQFDLNVREPTTQRYGNLPVRQWVDKRQQEPAEEAVLSAVRELLPRAILGENERELGRRSEGWRVGFCWRGERALGILSGRGGSEDEAWNAREDDGRRADWDWTCQGSKGFFWKRR
ncbi:hypothetical protein CALVIDRAFT_528089 [Calocera viscosa TUFC12733]|uniref:Uncharacterized protein n=1 Tax=Calocera viscosa (strain TUFC12733) TaxID=1330018 RepID=A0A167LGW8_CALVF|nr:hypothetical protein CALVIDRAFT_528089 [Calocera viscosa TUFC12733]